MKYLLITALILLGGCSDRIAEKHRKSYEKYYNIIIDAEKHAAPAARKVLNTTRHMSINHEVIKGGCWDYLDKAWKKAGYPYNKRQKIYEENKRGPYASVYLLQPGDWVYHINHAYKGIEHSGMFIDWIDKNRKIALMLSYAGERRGEPARYKKYDLSSVYSVIRVVE